VWPKDLDAGYSPRARDRIRGVPPESTRLLNGLVYGLLYADPKLRARRPPSVWSWLPANAVPTAT